MKQTIIKELHNVTPSEKYDLILMFSVNKKHKKFLKNMKKIVIQIFELMKITNIFDRVSVMLIRDYCSEEIIKWSSWKKIKPLLSFLVNQKSKKNSKFSSAIKTAIWEAINKVENQTLCILYTDDIPHYKFSDKEITPNYEKELEALGETKFRWRYICDKAKKCKLRIFPVNIKLPKEGIPFYTTLANVTGGSCFKEYNFVFLCDTTIDIILNLSGIFNEYSYSGKCFNTVKNMDDGVDYNFENFLFSFKPYYFYPDAQSIDLLRKRVGNLFMKYNATKEYRDLLISTLQNLYPSKWTSFHFQFLKFILFKRENYNREVLRIKLRELINNLKGDKYDGFKWAIEDMFCNIIEVETIIQKTGRNEGPYYVIDDRNLGIKFNDLCASDNFCSQNNKVEILKLLQKMRVSDKKPRDDSHIAYLPVDLLIDIKFMLLPHLICYGKVFSLRYSAIMAIFCIITGSILREDGIHFLEKNRGKWLDLKLDENTCYHFALIVMKAKEFALTEKEINFYDALIQVESFRNACNYTIEIEMGYSSNKTKRKDYKEICVECNQWRSTTLLIQETCVYCKFHLEGEYTDNDRNYSFMCECSQCHIHYAVHNTHKLTHQPLCHFCRENKKAPFIICDLCKNKFLYQNKNIPQNFICAVCNSESDRTVHGFSMTVKEFVCKFNVSFIGMQIENTDNFFNYSEQYQKMKHKDRLLLLRHFNEITEDDLSNQKNNKFPKAILNVKNIQEQIFNFTRRINLNYCDMCYHEFCKTLLFPICGNVRCSSVSCLSCLTTWYGILQPGKICYPAQLYCPYCKEKPVPDIINLYNKNLNDIEILELFDPSYMYGWCKRCLKINKLGEINYGDEKEPVENYSCCGE